MENNPEKELMVGIVNGQTQMNREKVKESIEIIKFFE